MLERAGVHEVFTLHDGHLDCVFMAARDHGFRLIDTRHEQAAAHAAEGWARTTGRPGCALVAAGPGITDAVTGVTNAYVDGVPMLVISGGAPLRDAEKLQLQAGFDQVALLSPITKWAHRITHTERIPDLVAQALRIATTGRPGPVYLEIPVDVIYGQVEEERAFYPERIRPEVAPAPPGEAVETAIEAEGPGSPERAESSAPSRSGRASRSSRTGKHTESFRQIIRCADGVCSTWRFSTVSAPASPTWRWCWGHGWACSREAGAAC
jgi:acetolactate synthase-1/2/3 large subunit